MRPILFYTFLLTCLFFSKASAQLSMSHLFTDNMVLQQNQRDPIWGTAPAGQKVAINFKGHVYTTIAGPNGKWTILLDSMKYGGPYELTVRSGDERLRFNNVMIGEVWLCSGQSNMDMPVAGLVQETEHYHAVNHAEYEIADAEYPSIRLLRLAETPAATPQTDIKTIRKGWEECSPLTVGSFSATAYFFARAVYRKTGIPIGLIQSSMGAMPAEQWTSWPVLKTMDDYRNEIEKLEQQVDPSNPYPLGSLFNGMIAPLMPYGIRGVIWYQGESNASRAYQYKELFPKMIKDWRDRWKQGDFPFYYVQLPVYKDRDSINVKSDWAELREAQLQTLSLPNTAMAVMIDFTDSDLHPANKQDFGLRLAMIALNKVYDKNVSYCGPLYKDAKVEGKSMRIFFSNPEVGFRTRHGDYLSGFYMAGEDRIFHHANAVVQGNTIVVTCKEVETPKSMRYAWGYNPVCNLCSNALIPASPFRTDNWEMVTRNNK